MIKKIFSDYRQALVIVKRNWLLIIGCFGCVYLFLEFLRYLSFLAMNNMLVGMFAVLLIVIFSAFLYLGLIKVVLKLSLAEDVYIKDLFSQWNNIWTMIVVFLAFMMTFSLSYEFFMFFPEKTGMYNLFSSFWLVFISSVFILFYSFNNIILVKHQMCFMDIFKYNFLFVKNHLLEVILFYLLFLVVNTLGMMFVYIGLLISIPISFLAQAIFFNRFDLSDKTE